jgi:hypothetical protein
MISSRPTIVGKVWMIFSVIASQRDRAKSRVPMTSSESNPALNASRPWIASSLRSRNDERSRSRDAVAPESSSRHQIKPRMLSLSAPIFVRECRRWLPVVSRSVLQATKERTEESKEAERRETRIQPPHPAGCGARRALRARLSASHHGSCQWEYFIPRLNLGQASWDGTGRTRGLPRQPVLAHPAVHLARRS